MHVAIAIKRPAIAEGADCFVETWIIVFGFGRVAQIRVDTLDD